MYPRYQLCKNCQLKIYVLLFLEFSWSKLITQFK